jgi:hypothetical protein
MLFLLMFLTKIDPDVLIGTVMLLNVMSCASWSDSPLIYGFMVQLLLLSINILSIKVAELLAILVGNYTVTIRL